MRLLSLILLIAAPAASQAQGAPARDPAPVRTTPFPDVPRDHWAFDAVESLRQKGILRGYPPSEEAVQDPAPRPAAPRRRPSRTRRR